MVTQPKVKELLWAVLKVGFYLEFIMALFPIHIISYQIVATLIQ